jgi:hypothetical protein
MKDPEETFTDPSHWLDSPFNAYLCIFSGDDTQELCMVLVAVLVVGPDVDQLATKKTFFTICPKIRRH